MKKKPTPTYRKKSLRSVTTRDYIDGMKAIETAVLRGEEEETTSSVIQEIILLPYSVHRRITNIIRLVATISGNCSGINVTVIHARLVELSSIP